LRERARTFDTEKIDYIIGEGERATLEQVPYLRRLLAVQPPAAAVA
jgi:NTE family protein